MCLRLAPPELDPSATDELQRRLQRALEVSGAGWVSTTTLRGRTWLRAGVINYLSTDEDADRVLDTLVEAASDRIDDPALIGYGRQRAQQSFTRSPGRPRQHLLSRPVRPHHVDLPVIGAPREHDPGAVGRPVRVTVPRRVPREVRRLACPHVDDEDLRVADADVLGLGAVAVRDVHDPVAARATTRSSRPGRDRSSDVVRRSRRHRPRTDRCCRAARTRRRSDRRPETTRATRPPRDRASRASGSYRSASVTKTSTFPSTSAKYAIRSPSGDHVGPCPSSTTSVRPDPSAPTE